MEAGDTKSVVCWSVLNELDLWPDQLQLCPLDVPRASFSGIGKLVGSSLAGLHSWRSAHAGSISEH